MSPFERNKVLKSALDVKHLAERLSQCPEVTRIGEDAKAEAWGLADSLAEVEGSVREFLDVQLPRITQENLSPSETFDVLLDIGEEFRHILYHVLEQHGFYRYLVPENMHVYGTGEGSGHKPSNRS